VIWFSVERSKVNVRVGLGLTTIWCGFELYECVLVLSYVWILEYTHTPV